MTTPPKPLYYLPGHGGQLHSGLGQALLRRGWDVTGRATVGEFRSLGFEDQVATVADDLRAHFWWPGAQVVANSFGAYLFLHAQARLPAFPGRVLLLSPIVGSFEDASSGQVFVPPRSEHLLAVAQAGGFAAPQQCEIHVGADDWQSVPAAVQALGAAAGMAVTVAAGRGHLLGADYVGPLLDRWLGSGGVTMSGGKFA